MKTLFKKPIWKFIAVFGKKYVECAITENKTIDEFLDNAPGWEFYTNADKTFCISANNELTRSSFGELTELTMKEAYNLFGIDILEEAREKQYCKISG